MLFIEWIALYVFAPLGFWVFPKRYRQHNKWFDNLLSRRTEQGVLILPQWVFSLDWFFDVFAFVCIALAGTGTFFYAKDPGAQATTVNAGYDWILGMTGAVFVIYKISVLSFQYWGESRSWRIFAAFFILVAGMIPTGGIIVMESIQVNNSNLTWTVTAVMSLLGSCALFLLESVHFIIMCFYVTEEASYYITAYMKAQTIKTKLITYQQQVMMKQYKMHTIQQKQTASKASASKAMGGVPTGAPNKQA
jgi:Zn-dependent protease